MNLNIVAQQLRKSKQTILTGHEAAHAAMNIVAQAAVVQTTETPATERDKVGKSSPELIRDGAFGLRMVGLKPADGGKLDAPLAEVVAWREVRVVSHFANCSTAGPRLPQITSGPQLPDS